MSGRDETLRALMAERFGLAPLFRGSPVWSPDETVGDLRRRLARAAVGLDWLAQIHPSAGPEIEQLRRAVWVDPPQEIARRRRELADAMGHDEIEEDAA